MRRFLAVGAVAIGVMLLQSGAANAARPSDRAQIESLYGRFANAFRRADVDGIMSLYVHNNSLFVFDVTTPMEHVGWDNYRTDRRNFFLEMKPPIGFRILEFHVDVNGNTAYTRSIQQTTAPMAHGGTLRMRARVTDVLRKINGRWLIVEEHASVPVDLPTGAAVF